MQFEVQMSKPLDDNSLLARYIYLLVDFKRFAVNESTWQEARDNIKDAMDYLQAEHGVTIIIEEDKK